MAQVIITINYREYPISCEDGGEIQIMKLGRLLDEKARSLTQALGQINENLLLAMVGLLIADELTEAKKELSATASKAEDQEKISALETKINEVTQQISLLEEAKSAAEKKSSDLENTIAENQKRITDLETILSQKEQQISALEEEKNSSAKNISDAETTALEAMEQISTLEQKLNQKEQEINELTVLQTKTEQTVNELKAVLADKDNEIEQHLTKISELEKSIIADNEKPALSCDDLSLIDEELAQEINSLCDQIKSVALKLKSM